MKFKVHIFQQKEITKISDVSDISEDEIFPRNELSSVKIAQGMTAISPVLITPQVKKGKKNLIQLERTDRSTKLSENKKRKEFHKNIHRSIEYLGSRAKQDFINGKPQFRIFN